MSMGFYVQHTYLVSWSVLLTVVLVKSIVLSLLCLMSLISWVGKGVTVVLGQEYSIHRIQ